jgi:membrane protease YdiL (CAAX protease family)
MTDFLELARAGKNEWWRYLISFPGILIAWLLVGSLPAVALVVYVLGDGDPATDFAGAGFVGIPILLSFTVTMLSFIPFIAATLLAVRFVHARSVRTLVTGAARIRWGRMAAAAGVWFALAGLIALTESLLYPGRYLLTFRPAELAVYLIAALVLIPIQTSSEELFFRGYLMQWIGLRLKNKWILAIVSGVIFFLPHAANPEMTATNGVLMGLGYFAFGLFAALFTLLDDGLELALGIHAANNLFSALVANYTVTALPSPAVFTVQTIDAAYGLISITAGMFIFFLIFFLWTAKPAG